MEEEIWERRHADESVTPLESYKFHYIPYSNDWHIKGIVLLKVFNNIDRTITCSNIVFLSVVMLLSLVSQTEEFSVPRNKPHVSPIGQINKSSSAAFPWENVTSTKNSEAKAVPNCFHCLHINFHEVFNFDVYQPTFRSVAIQSRCKFIWLEVQLPC